MIFEVGPVEKRSLSYIFTLIEQKFCSLKMYIQVLDDELSGDIETKFMLPLTTELQDHKEKCFVIMFQSIMLVIHN